MTTYFFSKGQRCIKVLAASSNMHIESRFWLWSSSLCRATWRVDVLFFQMFMSWHLLADNLLNDAAVCVGINSESISWSGWANFSCAGSLAFDVFTLLIYVRVKYDRPCLSISVQVLWAELCFLFFFNVDFSMWCWHCFEVFFLLAPCKPDLKQRLLSCAQPTHKNDFFSCHICMRNSTWRLSHIKSILSLTFSLYIIHSKN